MPLDRVQESPTHLDAATMVATSAVSAGVLTLQPNAPNESIYIDEIDITNIAGASAVTAAAPTTIATTNISGGLAFSIPSGVTAGQAQPTITATYPNGLKSQTPGAPVTFTLPTFATNQTIRLNVAYRSAP